MGAPVGNQNAAKAKKWTAAIERALCKKYGRELAEAMDELAMKFVEAVEKGDLAAFKEFGDRMEGKPTQQTEISGPDGGPVQTERTLRFVDDGVPEKA